MKLAAKVKLQPTPDQHKALKETLERANAACNYASEVAWQQRKFGKFPLQKLVYYDLRERFGLTAQVVVRCLSKVADAYKLDKKSQRTFKPHGAIAYDDRILSWRLDRREVSIWTLNGRVKLPFVGGAYQLNLLSHQRGESDLALIEGEFYLLATCEIETPEPKEVEDVLGVDLGIKNLATDSDGNLYSGAEVTGLRKRRRRQRKRLQAKGTRSAKRVLRRLSGREKRFAKDVNHQISKQLVKQAQDTGRGIALEELRGLRTRVTVRKSQRDELHSWSFHQLRQFIGYKAERAGVVVILVDPRHTSRTCPVCGCVDKRHRQTQAKFSCVSCGHADHADRTAALIIARRGWAVVNQPHGSS